VIENNLIEYNGQHPHLHHGVYADSDGLILRNNIVRNNAGFGLHCYPAVKNAVIANNLVHGHHGEPGILIACPTGGAGISWSTIPR
jgi:Right handed beta helix region